MPRKKPYYSLRTFVSYIATFRFQFLITFAIYMIANLALAVIPIFIGKFVAALATVPVPMGQVYLFTTILILCSVVHQIIWAAAEILNISLIVSRAHEYENIIFRHVITKPYPYFVGKFTGKISSYVTGLGREFREFIDNAFYNYADLVTKLPMIAFIMFTVNAYTGVAFLVSVLLLFLVGRKLVRYTIRAEREMTDESSTLGGYIIDVIANFVSVKAFTRESAESAAVARKRRVVIKKALRLGRANLLFWRSLGVVVRMIIWPGTILLNVYLFLHGRISLAQITTFISTLLVFSDYVWGVIWNVSQFNLKLARIEESYEYLFGERDVMKEHLASLNQRDSKHLPLSFDSMLALRDLTFAYPDQPDVPVLKDLNLEIQRNEKIGVVGRSGSGKTTLIKLLLGYYELPRSAVQVDGVSVDNRRLIDMISYVPQDTALFHRSIRDNISYGSAIHQPDQAIEAAAHRAHAHEFIVQQPDGYEAVVGERGIKLSMGQRQRIAIARAFLDDKPLLILDEATSALDSESELYVQRALEDLWSDKTVIAIAHRLSTLRHMDRIVVMDNGRIIEHGTHEELLAQRSTYHRLWQHQSNGVLVEE